MTDAVHPVATIAAAAPAQPTTAGYEPGTPVRVLVLCTRNSARSQMAEALLGAAGGGRVVAASAGSDPGPGVHPLAVAALAELGIDWRGRPARGLDAVAGQSWDAVITVCDAARDACPFLPGARLTAHWGLEDPAGVAGDAAVRLAAFRAARDQLRSAIAAFVQYLAAPAPEPGALLGNRNATRPRDASLHDARLRAALAAGRHALAHVVGVHGVGSAAAGATDGAEAP